MVTGLRSQGGLAQDVRMAGVEYVVVSLTPPFSVRVPLSDDWRLYLIRGGEVTFEADDAARTQVRLPAGSVVALSGVLQHRFNSFGATKRNLPQTPWPQTPWIESPLGQTSCDGVTITLGRIPKSRMAFLALFERIITLSSDEHREAVVRIAQAIDWIADEAARPGPESDAVIRRLAEITALEIGRHVRVRDGASERSTRQAANDQRILRAVSAFYASPEEKWSLERLADVAGMSRTAFAVRYRQLIGTTPLKSLRQLRLQLAAEQLAKPATTATMEGMARRVGYGSDAAFIRAFSKEFGETPGEALKMRKR